MAKYRKKPEVVEAIRNWNNPSEVAEFFREDKENRFGFKDGTWSVITISGVQDANYGDWIIKNAKGEFYPCKPDIFEQTYEKVEE